MASYNYPYTTDNQRNPPRYMDNHSASNYMNSYSYDRREDAPLPLVPPSAQNTGFDYPSYYGHDLDIPQHGADSPLDHDSRSAYDEVDAVPMHIYGYKHSSISSSAPVITPVYDDPFVRDIDPDSKKTWKQRLGRGTDRNGKKLGWFSGQMTWVCYILSIIQICVFIAEIAKNGQTLLSLARPATQPLTVLLQPSSPSRQLRFIPNLTP